ncbi:MAG: hypothetical protein IIA61_01910 [Candidatus Marinimicrobia bacterium]|nr:hypothetical protein [Candidatus Neomarinimicrobiota bacterium]MCH8010696.1 hypothetical protein [Candidatus Neomarinimicrobiota bacterium]MCH8069302.1 hypothetical protein [Candidatus Neomarinimicrobiota bacterium]
MKSSFYQETDSRILFVLPDELTYPVRETFFDETYGGKVDRDYIALPWGSSYSDTARDLIGKLDNQGMAIEANKLLSSIDETILVFQSFQANLPFFPDLEAHTVDDGSILLEWIFQDYRIGFSIETDQKGSSWYLITNKSLGEISASGFLLDNDLDKLILWLLNFIISHS